jgi:hypothetical protein
MVIKTAAPIGYNIRMDTYKTIITNVNTQRLKLNEVHPKM